MRSALPLDQIPDWGVPASPLVEATLALVHQAARERLEREGKTWESITPQALAALVTKADYSAVEARILESGYRFAWSAVISANERPDVYKLDGADPAESSFAHANAPQGEFEADGRALRGLGDNVVRHPADIVGTARFIRTNDRVLKYITDGVPPGTIAVIDDSGGTLTAPIIEQFAGVICAGGTVRSHLGILTREYNIPCLMNAKIAGIADGDTVAVEFTAPAKTTEDYQAGVERTARVWLLKK
jgi:phosphohistidine swiveling domain-containing protein